MPVGQPESVGDSEVDEPREPLSKRAKQGAGHFRVSLTLDQGNNHPVWKSGLGMWTYSGALKPELVLPDSDSSIA
eukprot:5990378-Alexandrium_andersonii.AAC.1